MTANITRINGNREISVRGFASIKENANELVQQDQAAEKSNQSTPQVCKFVRYGGCVNVPFFV